MRKVVVELTLSKEVAGLPNTDQCMDYSIHTEGEQEYFVGSLCDEDDVANMLQDMFEQLGATMWLH